jgi:hypothetical protein
MEDQLLLKIVPVSIDLSKLVVDGSSQQPVHTGLGLIGPLDDYLRKVVEVI